MNRDRLAFCLVVIAIVAAVAWLAEASYFGPARALDAEIAALQAELPQLQARLSDARTRLVAEAAQPATLPSELVYGDQLQSAEHLQGVVREAIAAGGGQALSSQTGVTELADGYSKVGLMLRARFDEHGLLAFTRQIETLMPAIVFESLDVQRLPVPGDLRSLDVTANLAAVQANASP